MEGPTRRAVLATGSVLAVSACLPGADPAPSRPDPDLLLRRRVAGQVRGLAATYAAVLAAFPGTTGLLPALAAEHLAHARALAGPPPSAGATSSATSSARPTVGPVPATLPAARGWLAGLERSAARRRTRQSLRAGADLARLLASIGGCNSAHAALLDREPHR